MSFWRKFSRAKFLLTAAGVRQLFKDLKTCQRCRRCRHATFWGSKKATSVALPQKLGEIFVACCGSGESERMWRLLRLPNCQLPAKLNVCLPLRLSICPSVRLSACPPVFPAVKCHSRSRSASQRIHVQFPQGKTSAQLKWQFQMY